MRSVLHPAADNGIESTMNAFPPDESSSAPTSLLEGDWAAPIQPDQEWANALTHGTAAIVWIAVGIPVVSTAARDSIAIAIACAAFILSAVAVFVASTLSHYWIHNHRLLERMRAWDQGLIYVMISGTYTPFISRFAAQSIRDPLLIGIWVAAAIGFYSKVFANHRINGISTASYLALGWIPAIPMIGRVPIGVLLWMAAGGVIYTLGVVLLLNDTRLKYLHAGWHLCVIAAAACHTWAIYWYVALGQVA